MTSDGPDGKVQKLRRIQKDPKKCKASVKTAILFAELLLNDTVYTVCDTGEYSVVGVRTPCTVGNGYISIPPLDGGLCFRREDGATSSTQY